MNLDCNLQTVEEKPATAIDSAAAQNKQHVDTRIDIVHLMFQNCQSNSK